MKKLVGLFVLYFIGMSLYGQITICFYSKSQYNDDKTVKAIQKMTQYNPVIKYTTPKDTFMKKYSGDTLCFEISSIDSASCFKIIFESKNKRFHSELKLIDLLSFCSEKNEIRRNIQLYISSDSKKVFRVYYYGGYESMSEQIIGEKIKK